MPVTDSTTDDRWWTSPRPRLPQEPQFRAGARWRRKRYGDIVTIAGVIWSAQNESFTFSLSAETSPRLRRVTAWYLMNGYEPI